MFFNNNIHLYIKKIVNWKYNILIQNIKIKKNIFIKILILNIKY